MSQKLMIFDHDPIILALLDEILTQAGYEVAFYYYGLPDQQEIVRVKPDLVLLDYRIGDECMVQSMIQLLGTASRDEVIPLIICSTARQHVLEFPAWGRPAGVSIVLKPFVIEELLATIRSAIAGATISPALPLPSILTGVLPATMEIYTALRPYPIGSPLSPHAPGGVV